MKITHLVKHNRLTNKVIMLSCLSAVLAIVGCKEKGTAEKVGQNIDKTVDNAERKIEQISDKASEKIDDAKQSAVNQYKSAEGYIDDVAMTQQIKTMLGNEPKLKSFKIGVVTVNNIVTVSGAVDSEQSIKRVIELVESQPQVKSVTSELLVSTHAVSE